jgi:hypothetical protein
LRNAESVNEPVNHVLRIRSLIVSCDKYSFILVIGDLCSCKRSLLYWTLREEDIEGIVVKAACNSSPIITKVRGSSRRFGYTVLFVLRETTAGELNSESPDITTGIPSGTRWSIDILGTIGVS